MAADRAAPRSPDRLHERPQLDWLWAGLLVGAHAIVVWQLDGRFDILGWHGPDRRAALYATLAGSTGTLLALAAAGLGIYVSASGERMRWLRRYAGRRGIRVWFSVVVALLATLAVSLAALAWDESVGPNSGVVPGAPWIRWAVEGILIVLVIRVIRMTFFFAGVLHVKLSDENEEHGRAPQRGIGFDD